jgi:hypothetical protein
MDYYWKSGIPIWNLDLMTSGRTNLFYLPKYFWKGEGERKAEQIRGRKR